MAFLCQNAADFLNSDQERRNVYMSSVFDLVLQVKPEHIDVLGHVNNVVYVQWMQDVASAHIETLGVGLDQYLEMKHAMVAVEHHVQYRKAAMLDEEIILRTWLYDINALYSFRQYAFLMPKIGLYYLQAIPNGRALKLPQVVQSVCHQPLYRLINR